MKVLETPSELSPLPFLDNFEKKRYGGPTVFMGSAFGARNNGVLGTAQ